MAWTAPKTWVVGEVLTAAGLNTHLRDNLNAVRSVALFLQSGFSSAGWAAIVADTIVLDDFGGSYAGGRFIAPADGRYAVRAMAAWTGATGSGSCGFKCDQYASDGVTALGAVSGDETSVLNGHASFSGLANMNAGQRLHFYAYNSATGAAGSLFLRGVVEAHG